MTPSRPFTSAARTPAMLPSRRGWLTRLLTLDAIWRERRRLDGLDRHMLRDMGLDETEARTEARRPAWDAPDRWLR